MYQEQGHRHVILDIPLLYESNLFHMVDKVLLVYVEPDLQLKRLISRDQSGEEQARARISSQIPIDQKVDRADGVIYNNGSTEESKQQLHQIFINWDVM